MGLFKSNNLARYLFSFNSCSRPTSFIIGAMHIYTFDQTDLVGAFVQNPQFLLIVFIFLFTALVEVFNSSILWFIEKEVIQHFDLLLRIVDIILRNLISPKP